MIELTNIRKSFGDREVLHGINLSIKTKTVIGLLGPNGAGKTTLMRVLVGFYGDYKGEIRWNGKIVENFDKEYRAMIGYLPENNPLYSQMTVMEYLSIIGGLKGKVGDFEELIAECGLEEQRFAVIETLSKGYKQRVGIAAALIGNPKLLVLDEPTTGLDPNQIIEIRKLIKKMARTRTVILSTHILTEAKEVSDELLIINNGSIVLSEKTSKVRNLEKKFVELTQ